MRPNLDPKIVLSAAFGLLLLGFILPVLMVMQVIESTLFLNFFSYIAMTLGSMLGFVGTTTLMVRRRRRK